MASNEYFGINISLQHCLKYPPKSYALAVKNIGARWVRLEIDWYDRVDDNIILGFVEELQKNDIKIIGVLMGLVPGTFTNLFIKKNRFKSPYDNIDNFLEFSKNNVLLLKDHIHHWEIYNEQNTYRFWRRKPSPEEYALFFEKVSDEIKLIDKNAVIITGGILLTEKRSHSYYMREMVKIFSERRLTDKIDYYAIHPYTLDSYLNRHIGKSRLILMLKNKIKQFREEYPDKELMITEYGISSILSGFSDRDIGEIYAELRDFCSEQKIYLFLWMLVDFRTKEYFRYNPECHFGVYRNNLEPKESAKILKIK